jgi:hypothetical protein
VKDVDIFGFHENTKHVRKRILSFALNVRAHTGICQERPRNERCD